MENQRSDSQWWWYALLGGLVLLIGFRFLVALRFLLLPLLVLGGIGLGGYWLWSHLQRRRRERAYRQSTEGIMEAKLQHCQEQMALHRRQIEEIEASIAELEEKLQNAVGLTPHIEAETKQLIAAFQAEQRLREAKWVFFDTCRAKLEQMLHQHHLAKELEAKKAQLEALRERHYDDLAAMESLRAQVEMESFHLDTIENLSRRMETSASYSDAQRLLSELQQMTEDLDKM